MNKKLQKKPKDMHFKQNELSWLQAHIQRAGTQNQQLIKTKLR